MNACRPLFYVLALVFLLTPIQLYAQEPSQYARAQWWPSEWGKEDELGALNRLTPAKVLEAAQLIEQGVIYDMTHVFEEDMPLFDLTPGARKYTLSIPGAPSWGPLGENKLAW
ncbi:MAG TPA: hypothetical protein VI566_01250, partial [Xanthomonadales bacterium]|nr:hypothetical protein [Xanthomonadales bacterium]